MIDLDSQVPESPPQGGDASEPKLVMVVDTDQGIRWALDKGLAKSGYIVRTVAAVGEALAIANEEPLDAVVMELLPEAALNFEFLSMLAESPSEPRIVCVSVESDPQTVIECMQRGAVDFLPKPFSLPEIRNALHRALTKTVSRRLPGVTAKASRPKASEPSLIIGISQAIQELRTTIEQIAKTDLNCLLRGASGTGKDMVARELHRLSRRSDKPFVKVNCTALPDQLLESELFGYEKGAFTGAVTSKPGRFELAHKGIIFLDEIGDMDANLQTKLLQVIEHKEFTKLGGTRHIKVDVQIIAATNADLERKTKDGSFRDDLYFRLNEVSIWLPTLKERKEDIPLLVRHFIQKHNRFGSGAGFELSRQDLAELIQQEWPGNVRELESTIKRWLALGKKTTLSRPTVHRIPSVAASVPETPSVSAEEIDRMDAPPAGQVSEPDMILDALENHHWNRRKAAEALGMSYQTLRRRIEKYGLNQPR